MNKKLLNIETIRKYILKRNILWTKHCLNRLNQRNITVADVKRAIINGEITVYYPDSKDWKEDNKTRRKNHGMF